MIHRVIPESHQPARWAFAFAALILAPCTSALSALVPTAATTDRAVITIDASRPGPAINPRMYGVFLEEINHSVDGGLYGELVRNRGFEDSREPEGYVHAHGRWENRHGFPAGFERFGYRTDAVPFWSLVREGAARGAMHLEKNGGITPASAYCLRLEAESVSDGRLAVANEGFFGIGAKTGTAYRLALHARASAPFSGPLRVRLEDAQGRPCSDELSFSEVGPDWKKLGGVLTASATDPKARLVVSVGAVGTVWLDFVSLFPERAWKDRPNGLRPDLAQLVADLRPGFVRFPGGCVVEAGSLETAYDWKLTVGPVESRIERWGPWSQRRTQGMGLLEYLQFCEDLGAEPLYVGFAGQTCIFRAREHVPMEDMPAIRDNLLDAVEFANGAPDTRWGSLRAQAGRADPFDLKLLEIGNENQGPEFGRRYRLIQEAIATRFPKLTTIADLSFTNRESLGGAHFDIEDQHYYNSPRWFASGFRMFDGRDRALQPLYLGEVASTTGEAGPTRGNLRAALSESVFLLGCERNADVVQMVSYAPLLGHVEGRTELPEAPPPWHAMIYFDGTRSYGTASYQAWKMLGTNRPDRVLRSDLAFPDAAPFAVRGEIGLGTWADSAEFKDVRVERNGEVVYQSDFSRGTEGWRPASGHWSVVDGAYRQSRPGQGFAYFGDPAWQDYTLTLRARHLRGPEGFLVVFGRQDENRLWWNLGGWGNSQHAVEQNQTVLGAPARGRLESDRWYDVKVEVRGAHIRCFLDGVLVHETEAAREETFFTVAGRDEASGEVVLKAVNLAAKPVPAELRLPGLTLSAGREALLTSRSLDDNNQLDAPLAVSPVERAIPVEGDRLSHEFPPHSLTILRLQPR